MVNGIPAVQAMFRRKGTKGSQRQRKLRAKGARTWPLQCAISRRATPKPSQKAPLVRKPNGETRVPPVFPRNGTGLSLAAKPLFLWLRR